MRGYLSEIEQFRLAQDAFSNRHIGQCLDFLAAAQALGYNPDDCAGARWYCWMLLGRFEEAWRESDAIAARGCPDPNRLWDGLPFSGKRVIIRCLHGFGDAIQFVRYARLVRHEAASVTVQTHPQLVTLFRGADYVDHVSTWTDGPGIRGRDWDQQIEVMELPRAFRTTLETIPNHVPYLRVEHTCQERSRRALSIARKPRVGFLWEASDFNPARNISVEALYPILENPDVDFYSFQRGPGRKLLASLPQPVTDLAGDSPDVAAFAADLLNMDLLITVDTMAAHLTGALGRNVWLLLAYEADWRWMLDRSDSPWYPTMRLFRQRTRNDWSLPVAQIAAELSRISRWYKSK